MDDGFANTDWEKIESIMVVLTYNLRRFHEKTEGRFPLLWSGPWAGVAPKSFLSPPSQVPQHGSRSELDMLDPFQITGTWMRVCLMCLKYTRDGRLISLGCLFSRLLRSLHLQFYINPTSWTASTASANGGGDSTDNDETGSHKD